MEKLQPAVAGEGGSTHAAARAASLPMPVDNAAPGGKKGADPGGYRDGRVPTPEEVKYPGIGEEWYAKHV